MIPSKASDSDNLRIHQLNGNNTDETFGKASLYALQEDSKTLIDKAFAYCVYVFGIDQKDLHEDSYSLDLVMKWIAKWNKDEHKKMYTETKKVWDALYQHILPVKESQDISAVDNTVHDALRAVKSIKNVYHNIQDLKQAESKELKELYNTLLTHAITVSSHIAAITDREYSAENFQELTAAQKDLQQFHSTFIEQLTEIDTKKLPGDMTISSLINIDHYVTQSMNLLVNSVKHAYLTQQEWTAFNQLRE